MQRPNPEDPNADVKVCPECGAKIAIRRYSESYDDYEIDPDTGEEAETAFDSVDQGESDWKLHCTKCQWELWGDEVNDADDSPETGGEE